MKSSDTDMNKGKQKTDMDHTMDKQQSMNKGNMDQSSQQSGGMESMNRQSGMEEGTSQQSNRSGLGQKNANPPEMMTDMERMDARQVGNMQSGTMGAGNMQSDPAGGKQAVRPDQAGKPPRSGEHDVNRPGNQNQSGQGNNQSGQGKTGAPTTPDTRQGNQQQGDTGQQGKKPDDRSRS